VPLERVARLFERVEDGVLVAFLMGMLALAGAQILLRNLFDVGLVWADPLLRQLVLWTALIGAMVAARKGQHIAIDLLSRWLPAKAVGLARIATDVFTTAVCWLLAFHGARLVAMEWQAGPGATGAVPAWLGLVIVPVGFGVIGLRYLVLAYLELVDRGDAAGRRP
jgi:TRAP-type C4-dicarboxylate transport system permease small subunit